MKIPIEEQKTLILVGLLFVVSIFYLNTSSVGVTREVYCLENSDCLVSGCSGEVCYHKERMTPCVYREEFECLAHTSCKCLDGVCAWVPTPEYIECMNNFSDRKISIV